jgi:Transposase DDE domain
VDLAETVYALDATTIDLCLSVFPWAPFRSTKAAIKLHTLLDLRGSIPSFGHISDGKLHDVNVLELLLPEPGAYYVMDRGYLDFERLYRLHEAGSFFVTRAKSNLKAERRYSHPVDRASGVICDQTVVLSGFYSHKGFPSHQVPRSQRAQAAHLSDQPIRLARPERRRLVSLSSNGSNSICASRRSWAPPRTPSRRRSRSPCRCTCSSPSSRSASNCRSLSMKLYGSSWTVPMPGSGGDGYP